jgi:hypothetical protein
VPVEIVAGCGGKDGGLDGKVVTSDMADVEVFGKYCYVELTT